MTNIQNRNETSNFQTNKTPHQNVTNKMQYLEPEKKIDNEREKYFFSKSGPGKVTPKYPKWSDGEQSSLNYPSLNIHYSSGSRVENDYFAENKYQTQRFEHLIGIILIRMINDLLLNIH